MGCRFCQDGDKPVRLIRRLFDLFHRLTRIIISIAADSFFGRRCLECGEFLTDRNLMDLCPICSEQVIARSHPSCARCGAPESSPSSCICHNPASESIDSTDWAFAWAGPVRGMVLALKYSGRWELAGQMAAAMAAAWATSGMPKPDVVTCVPLTPRRFLSRGYNQAAVLARAFSELISVPCETGLLQRTRFDASTRGRDRKARLESAAGAFRVRKPVRIKSKSILLIDDVMTTGATAGACCRALKEAGAGRTDVMTFARAIDGA